MYAGRWAKLTRQPFDPRGNSPRVILNEWPSRLHSRYELAGEEINCLFLPEIRRLFIRNPALKPVANLTARSKQAYDYAHRKTISESDHSVYALKWKSLLHFVAFCACC